MRYCGLTRKRAFPSSAVALNAAQIVTLRSGVALGAYECPLCGAWHLTRQVWRDGTLTPKGWISIR